jgi:hypothetical protein
MNSAYERDPNKFYERDKRVKEELNLLILEAKKNGCLCCPEKNPICLDFHHKDPKKKDKAVAKLLGFKNKERLLNEIKKCIVVCANCHRKIHAGVIAP